MNEAHTLVRKQEKDIVVLCRIIYKSTLDIPFALTCEGAKKGFYNSMYYFHCASHFFKKVNGLHDLTFQPEKHKRPKN